MKQLLQTLKTQPALYEFLRYKVYARIRSINRAHEFRKIYEDNLWDGDFSVSGPGSSLESTESLRKVLPTVLANLGTRTILDIPCGDFQWMKHVPLGVEQYIGADIVRPLVEENRLAFGDRGLFLLLDLLCDRLPTSDVIFCRDCLVHLSFREIELAFHNIKRTSAKYLMTTTFPYHKKNIDTVTPYWRALNLQLSPFNLRDPICLIKDYSDHQRDHQGKYLGVWQMDSLHHL